MADEDEIFLFGATSLIGWNLLRLAGSRRIVPFCNRHAKRLPERAWRRLNFEDEAGLREAFRHARPRRLFYCAAVCDIEKCEAAPEWATIINVDAVERLLRHIPDPTRLIYCSSDHVFSGDTGPYTEHSQPDPISVYGQTRVAAEALVRERRGDSLIIRCGLVIGPSADGRSGHLDWLRYRAREGLPITIVKGESRSAAYAANLIPRLLALAEAGITGLRHIPATPAVSRVVLADYLNERFGLNASIQTEQRADRRTPHLGNVDLRTIHDDDLSRPLPPVVR